MHVSKIIIQEEHKMKKLIALLLTLTFILSLSGAALAENKLEKILSVGEITFATSPDFAPCEFINPNATGDDQYVGADVELAKYIAESLGVKLVIMPMEFSALQAAITQGKVDMAISGFAYTEERAENMQLSAFFNYTEDEGQGLLVLKDKAAEYATAESFAGKTIGAQNGSLQYSLTEEQLPDAEIKLISTLGDGILMVQNSKIDGLACSGDQARLYVEKNSDLAIADWTFNYSSSGNIVLCKKGETALVAEINKALAEVNDQGLYAQWKADATELAESLGIETN